MYVGVVRMQERNVNAELKYRTKYINRICALGNIV